jgi:NAD(P)-dependent dehydrogenase (short-subunit alcohol dehydrogenase family)
MSSLRSANSRLLKIRWTPIQGRVLSQVAGEIIGRLASGRESVDSPAPERERRLHVNDLNGKIAVVTGASRGLGRRIAVRLAQEGAAVALVARGEAGLEVTRQQIAAMGARVLSVPADLGKPESVSRVKEVIERDLGIPSILVNAAGVFGPIDLIKDGDPAPWIEAIMINTVSAYLTSRAFVGGMIEGGWGRIVNVTSAAALHEPGPANSAYGTSKAALNQFTRHLASELKGTGVTANVIHPGDVKTDMWAQIKAGAERLGRVAEGYTKWADWVEETGGDDPEKAADLVGALMKDDAAGINGRFLWIKDGLQSPIPSWGEPVELQPWQK